MDRHRSRKVKDLLSPLMCQISFSKRRPQIQMDIWFSQDLLLNSSWLACRTLLALLTKSRVVDPMTTKTGRLSFPNRMVSHQEIINYLPNPSKQARQDHHLPSPLSSLRSHLCDTLDWSRILTWDQDNPIGLSMLILSQTKWSKDWSPQLTNSCLSYSHPNMLANPLCDSISLQWPSKTTV